MSAMRPVRGIEIGIAAALAAAVAGFGGVLTDLGPWYFALKQPAWKPPDWLFGPAWTAIFTCIATSGVIGWRSMESSTKRRRFAMALGINAVFNIAWSALFFRMQRPDWALVEVVLLWGSILVLVLMVYPSSRLAAGFLLPYLAWVGFAACLNAAIVQLNAPFG